MSAETYEPDDDDIAFAEAVITMTKDGGMWILPTTKLVYTLHHGVKVMVLTNPDRLSIDDNQLIHDRTKAVWSRVGWTILP